MSGLRRRPRWRAGGHPQGNDHVVRQGSLVIPTTNREMVYDSTLERDLICIAATHRDARALREQPKAITYIDVDGRERNHTFDLVVDLKDMTRLNIAVKPAAKVASSGIEETLELIRATSTKGRRETFVLRTGYHITRARAADARLILKSRRMRDDACIAEVGAVASRLRGTVRIADLMAATRNDGHGFMAVVCLIDDGVLDHAGPGRISADSAVRPARKPTESHRGKDTP
ncbi:hypothetical protein ACFQY9_18350 [Microvirga aerilata]|uniref:hypothetical protein n=1 Tax=Microvirga aerilata TaxID=670292 RepID=UPI003631DEEB